MKPYSQIIDEVEAYHNSIGEYRDTYYNYCPECGWNARIFLGKVTRLGQSWICIYCGAMGTIYNEEAKKVLPFEVSQCERREE